MQNETPITPLSDQKRYQLAYEEWSSRVGNAESQLKNWRLAFLLSMLLLLVLSFCLYSVASMHDRHVYIAEVKAGEHVINVQTLPERATPTNAQEAYFINQFLQYTMTLPIDPVIARENWLNAYKIVEGTAIEQLTNYARAHNPFENIGVQTQSIQVEQYHPVSNRSYEVTWIQTTFDTKGHLQSKQLYHGVFTLSQGDIPKTVRDIVVNPLGLKISYFTFSKEGEGS